MRQGERSRSLIGPAQFGQLRAHARVAQATICGSEVNDLLTVISSLDGG
jgi:hypothetical protein